MPPILKPASADALPRLMIQQRPEGYVLSDAARSGYHTIFLMVFTVIWNLVSCPIVLAFLFSGASHRFPLVLISGGVSLLFGGIGIVLIVFLIRRLLIAARFQAAELVFHHWPLRLGESIDVSFRRQSRGVQMTQVEAGLRCTEVASYKVGTDRSTVRELVWEQPLAAVPLAPGARAAEATWRIQIPSDAPPSFDTMDNSIEWKLDIKLRNAGFPDADSSFILVVLPEVLP